MSLPYVLILYYSRTEGTQTWPYIWPEGLIR